MMEESTNIKAMTLVKLMNCQATLSSISRATDCCVAIDLFKNLLEDISKCLELLKIHPPPNIGKNQPGMLLLCISQIHKCLPLLLKVVETMTKNSLYETQESKRYVSERIRWCLSDLSKEIEDNTVIDNNGCGSKFVHTVDVVLDLVTKLLNLSEKEDIVDGIEELKPIIEELLCHAMTIAQISEPSDYQTIIDNSQKVLRAFDQLNIECMSDEESQSMWHLFANSLAGSLESLEQQVNTSVLRLVLQVFCKPYAPVKSLVQRCVSSKPVLERRGSDLDEMVVELDLHMDRVMQIGLFAMACTGDAKRILNIRSCLASLESLESELVPTLTAFYLEPTNPSHRRHLKLVTTHWQAEIMELHDLLDAIVDPAAFCQVTAKEVKHLSMCMKSAIDSNNTMSVKEDALRIIQRTKKLVRHLQTTLGECSTGTPGQEGELSHVVQDLNKACYECEVCFQQVFMGQEDQDKTQWKRILKRCQLIVSTIKKLHPLLILLVNTSQMENKQNIGNGVLRKCLSDDHEKSGHHRLLPYLDAGKLLSQERSIMYTTPKHQVKMSVAGSKLQGYTPRVHRTLFNDDSPRIKNGSACQLLRTDDNLTLGLEITAVLEKLSLCCYTLSSTLHPRYKSQSEMNDHNYVKTDQHTAATLNQSSSSTGMFSCSSLSDLLEHIRCDDVHVSPIEDVLSSTTVRSDQDLFQTSMSVSCVSTLERMNDLQKIDGKIEILKEQFQSS